MIYLREIAETDLPLIGTWRQDPEICRWLVGDAVQTTPESTLLWWHTYLQAKPTQARFAICLTDTQKMIGRIDLLDIKTHQDAELQILIAQAHHRHQGYGLQATRLCLEHAFHTLKLHSVYLRVLAQNHGAIRLYTKAGFMRAPTPQPPVIKEGKEHAVIQMIHKFPQPSSKN
jgi:diamine N-acetyltransferase